MIFKLIQQAQKNWNRLPNVQQLQEVLDNVIFINGIKEGKQRTENEAFPSATQNGRKTLYLSPLISYWYLKLLFLASLRTSLSIILVVAENMAVRESI